MSEKEKKRSEEPEVGTEDAGQENSQADTGAFEGVPLTEKISDVADKGAKVLKDVFDRVTHVASEAADSTRLRMDIYRLKSDRDKLFTEIGRKTYELHRSDSMDEWADSIADNLQKIADLEARLKSKEEELSNISLDFKGKPKESSGG